MESKKKILIFIDWFLPGYKAGGPVTSMANMIDLLHNQCDFYMVTRNSEYMETEPYSGVRSDEWNLLGNHVHVYYSSSKKSTFRTWAKLMSEHEFHCIYINGIYSFKFSILPLMVSKINKFRNIIVSPRGMLASSAISVKGSKKKLFLKAVSLLGLYKGIRWHATNEKEASQIREVIDREAIISIADNLPRKMPDSMVPISKKANELNICSLTRISPEKNTLYALECLKDIPAHIQLTYHIYGQIYNKEYWQECEKIIEELPSNVVVTYMGTLVPANVIETIGKYQLMLLPTRGENFGHVILESFMAGRPVLISDQTPWKNLEENNAGWELPLNEPNVFSEVIKKMGVMEKEEYEKWCVGAFQFALKNQDSELINKYLEMFGDVWDVRMMKDERL